LIYNFSACQAALVAAGNQEPAIGYSVAYPFGVIGPIVLMTIMAALLKPQFAPPSQTVRFAELTLNAKCHGRTVGEVAENFQADVKLVAVRQSRDPCGRITVGPG
jgi:putative transport protein